MEQSLIAAVSGIDANQNYLDIIGNNIANANTTGYKSEDADFTDLLAEQLSGASAPSANGTSAGVDPVAIGAGVRLAGVSSDETQGSINQTDVSTDVAIQGNGFLVTQFQGQQLYTRNGQLTFDANGNLATSSGDLIQGWEANASGVIDTNAPIGNISVPAGKVVPANATSELTLGGNLPAWDGTGTSPVVNFTYNAYDALGNVVPISFTMTGVANQAGEWSVAATVPNGATPANLFNTATPPIVTFSSTTGQITGITTSGGGPLAANADGSYSLDVDTMPPSPTYNFPVAATIAINFPEPTSIGAVTQFSGEQSLQAISQDGNSSGTLESFSIGGDGVISGSYSNGINEPIAQIALATFSNPGGLSATGNLMFAATPNSGQAAVSTPGNGGAGTLIGGSLESSNVNLSSQLTDLIVAQEAYEANTKVISTTNTTLQALVQMA